MDPVKGMKKKATDGEKIYSNHIPEKGLDYIEEFSKFYSKK